CFNHQKLFDRRKLFQSLDASGEWLYSIHTQLIIKLFWIFTRSITKINVQIWCFLQVSSSKTGSWLINYNHTKFVGYPPRLVGSYDFHNVKQVFEVTVQVVLHPLEAK
ncbi:hypothetical protein M8C21_003473, partial [Ambrosia artemisiifolia]